MPYNVEGPDQYGLTGDFSLSGDASTTSDAVHLAANVAALLARQQHIDRRDLDRLTRAAILASRTKLHHRLRRLTTGCLERRPERARSHDIGADALLEQLLGERFGVGEELSV